MSVDNPTNTIILINVIVIGSPIFLWFLLVEVLSRMALSARTRRNWQWGVAAVLGGWLIAWLAMEFGAPSGQPLGTVVTVGFVVFGLVVGTLPLAFSPTFRQILRATPITWLIGFQIVRVVGGSFLGLLDMKLLPANFALPAGYGDVLVGILASVVVFLLATNKPYARTAAILWNVLGVLDLTTALATGTIFIPGYGVQLATTGVSVAFLNYVFIIPAYGVPLTMLLHIYTFYKLLSGRTDEVKLSPETPVKETAFAK